MRICHTLLLLFSACLASFATRAAESCAISGQTSDAHVRYVHDGDTLFLTDGRKLRLIGLNAPELATEHKPAEPLAIQTRDRLRKLVDNSRNLLKIQTDQLSKDKYGRFLVHAFLADGSSISHALISDGLAISLLIPPNLQYWRCYEQAEAQARNKKLGIWALPSFQTLSTADIPEQANGFFIVKGIVLALKKFKSSALIKLDHNLDLYIDAEDMRYFTDALKTMDRGTFLTAKGWIHPRKDRLTMRIRHPSAIEYNHQ